MNELVNDPTFGSTPAEIVEAVKDGTYEAQPGLAAAVETGAVPASVVSTTPAAPTATPETAAPTVETHPEG